MTTLASASQRFLMMDVSRGFAILGILWLNIFIAGMPFSALAIPGIWGESDPVSLAMNINTWVGVSIYVDGVMRGMISVLFGASALLMLQKAEADGTGIQALDAYFRRLLALIGLGMIHAYLLLWPYDILFLYGLFGLFLFPLRNLPVKWLVGIGLVLLCGSILIGAEQVSKFTEAQGKIDRMLQPEQIEEGREAEPIIDQLTTQGTTEEETPSTGDQRRPDQENDPGDFPEDPDIQALILDIANEIEARHQGYLDNLFDLATTAFEEQTTEVLSHHFLDVMPMLLFGMALLKSGFFTGQWPARRLAAITAGGLSIGWFTGQIATGGFDFGDGWVPYIYDPRRISLVFAYFSLVALVLRSGYLGFAVNALAACGRMALTLYICQSIAYALLFYGFGFSTFGDFEHREIALIAVVMTLIQLIVAPVYLRIFRQGPLEWLLRRASGVTG